MSTPDAAVTGQRRVPWKVTEVVAALLAAAVTVLAAGKLAAFLVGIDLHFTEAPRVMENGWALVLGAFGWETVALLLVGPALALVWWEVDARSTEAAAATPHTARHLARARLLALWLGLGLVAAAGAAVAYWLPFARGAIAGDRGTAQTWTRLVGDGAVAACTLLAAGGGVYLVGTLVRRCAPPAAVGVTPTAHHHMP